MRGYKNTLDAKKIMLSSVLKMLLSERMPHKIIFVILLSIVYAAVNATPISESLQIGELRGKLYSEVLKYTQLNYSEITSLLNNVGLNFNQFPTTFNNKQVHPDWNLNVVKLIKKYGYPVETHTVTTEDGYILTIHRIPHGKNSNYNHTNKQAVLLMPGTLCSSADWVVNGPEKAIGYLLADEGYDVWLGNARGTTWSRKHVTLKPNADKEFWDFSYHEMGIFDLPATIDYILEQTQQPDLFYIGHSQGTSSFFVMASELPEYNNKIRLMSAFGPAVYSSNLQNPFLPFVLPYLDDVMELANELEIYEFFRHSFKTTLMGQILCNDDADTQDLCPLVMFLVVGFNEPQLNKTMLPVIYSNFPAGASVKQMWHFAQGVQADGKFLKYDYGTEQNIIKYGQETPPEYDLSKVTSRIALYYSTNDWLSSDKDVRQLISVLPNVVLDQLIEKFNHLDYMWATDAKTLLYDYVIAKMKKL